MLSKEVFGHILTYRGGKGLRGAMDAWGEGVREIEVEDPGVLLDTNTKMDYESLLAYEKDRQKRGELPGIWSGSRFLVNYPLLMQQLEDLSRKAVRAGEGDDEDGTNT